jgi:hypothetical protein
MSSICFVFIIISSVLYLIISSICLCDSETGLAYLNPCFNKKHFDSLNWFGVMVVTIFFTILLLPYAPFYWFYKLMTAKKKDK